MTDARDTWVLLRGLAREQGHWGDFPARLAEALGGARVVTLDLPGSGVRHRERCPPDVPALLAACRAQLATQGLDGPLRLVGLSLGGMVVAQWLHEHPDEVACAVVINSSTRRTSGPLQRLRPSAWPLLLRIVRHWGTREAEHAVLRLTSARPDRHAAVLGAWMAIRRDRPVSRSNALRQLVAAARWRLPDTPPGCPVLVVAGARDALVDPRCSAALAAHWDCEYVEHPQAGHDLPLDAPDWLVERIAPWCLALPR